MQAVKTIDNLIGNDDFRRFMERFTRRSDQLADDVLHDDSLSKKKREKLRNIRLGLLEILLAPDEDRKAQVRVLAQYGISIGDRQ